MMTEKIIITKYSSRRLYNTQTSEYVTLDQIAEFIRDGKEVQIIDKETNEEILVPSVAGNAVLFPSHYIHTGTPPSNLDHRCCLNIIFESQHHL